MKLKLTKPVMFFDLETTGTNILHDRIVEMSMIKVYPDGHEEERTIRINPGMHIPEEASSIHHIFDEDVADKPAFKQVATQLAKSFEGCDIAGFNSNKFDIRKLRADARRRHREREILLVAVETGLDGAAQLGARLDRNRRVAVDEKFHFIRRRAFAAHRKHVGAVQFAVGRLDYFCTVYHVVFVGYDYEIRGLRVPLFSIRFANVVKKTRINEYFTKKYP